MVKNAAQGAIFFTINQPMAGETVIFLNSEEIGHVASSYQKDGAESEERGYVNALFTLLYDGITLRPYAFPYTSIIGKSSEPIDKSLFPQFKHETTLRLARQGERVFGELVENRTACPIEATYPILIDRQDKDKGRYAWTTIGIGKPESESYKVINDEIVFGKAKISIDEIKSYFDDVVERQSARL